MHLNYNITQIFPQNIFDLVEIKNFLRVSYEHDNLLINNLINATIAIAEDFTGLSILHRKVELKVYHKGHQIDLKYNPLIKVQEVYLLKNNIKTILNQNQYFLNNNKIELDKVYGSDEIVIIYEVGLIKENISPSLRQALLMHISNLYERGDNSVISNEIRSIYLFYRQPKL